MFVSNNLIRREGVSWAGGGQDFVFMRGGTSLAMYVWDTTCDSIGLMETSLNSNSVR